MLKSGTKCHAWLGSKALSKFGACFITGINTVINILGGTTFAWFLYKTIRTYCGKINAWQSGKFKESCRLKIGIWGRIICEAEKEMSWLITPEGNFFLLYKTILL